MDLGKVKNFLKTPFFNFAMCVVSIFLIFVLPELLSGITNPVFLMIACVLVFFYFGRRLVRRGNWR